MTKSPWSNSIAQRNKNQEIKFWEKVRITNADDCWEWIASKNRKGYGNFYISLGNSKELHTMAHRFSWCLEFGKVPDGMSVCHKCDNPSCVNPSHLFLGTAKDNVQDMIKKGRSAHQRGYKNHSVIGWDEVYRIRELGLCGNTGISLAKQFGVSISTISRILRKRSWVK